MIYPVILCGGSGTRLWPLSRKSYPKQFAPLLGAETLFQSSARRLSGPDFAAPIVVTGSDFRFIVMQQLAEIGITPNAVLIEPSARNTAPAVLAATLWALAKDPDSVLLVAPSDHAIPDGARFCAAVLRGLPAASSGQIVTFGIAPTRPETGYGYLELAEPLGAEDGAIPLRRFVEKPDLDKAQSMLAAGNFLWNAGIFLFRAADMRAAFAAHAPDVLPPVTAALAGATSDFGFLRLAPKRGTPPPIFPLTTR